jgi:hypothetical protein
MAGNHEKIRKTIVVQINDARSPTDISGFDPNARGSRFLKTAGEIFQ